MRPLVLTVVLLVVACSEEWPTRGAEVARFTVRSFKGEEVGTSTVWQAANDPDTWVEQTRAGEEDMKLQVDAVLRLRDGNPVFYRARRQANREVDLVTVEVVDGVVRWSRQKGLVVRRAEVPGSPRVIIEETLMPGVLPAGSAVLGMLLARQEPGWESAPVFNAREGRWTRMIGGVREPGTVARWFVKTPASGHSLRVEGKRLVWMDRVLGGFELVAPGYSPPPRVHPPLPAGVVEEEVKARGTEVELAGTLSRPAPFARPPPVAILVPGSGPTDRDESSSMVFRDLAHGLSAAGWAVVRYDKRGVGESRNLVAEPDPTIGGLAGDVRTWMQALSTRADVDGRCVVLLGHSEGGLLAPWVASQDERVRGVVMLAGPVHSMLDVLREQAVLILQAHGATPEEIRQVRREQEATIKAIVTPPKARPRHDKPPEYVPWMRSHAAHDGLAVLRGLQVPLLALYAELDVQVPPTEGDRLRTLVREAGRTQFTVEVLEGLDHLLMKAHPDYKGMGALMDPDRRLDPKVIERVVRWLGELPCAAR